MLNLELFLSLVVHSQCLTFRDQFVLACTCSAAYKVVEASTRAQVQRVVAHMEQGRVADPAACLLRYVNIWTPMETSTPRIPTWTSLLPITVLQRSLIYAMLCAWFDTWGATLVDSTKTWICPASADLMPTSLPNEDGRCRFGEPGEYMVTIKTHVFTDEVLSVHCTDDYRRSTESSPFRHQFDVKVMTKVLKSVKQGCGYHAEPIMRALGFSLS